MFLQIQDDKTKALLLTLLIVTLSVFPAWWISGWQLAALIALIQLAVIYIARNVWMSDKSNFILRSAALAIVTGAILLKNSVWQELLQFGLGKMGFQLNVPDYVGSPLMLLFLLILVTIVFHYTRSTAIDKPHKPIERLLQGPTIKQKWASICESLSNHIRDIDRATNWSHEYYTPLEAEVEMKTSTGVKKVVKDLLEAIKASDDRLFLMIGDPGAGKSVALRKLCIDVLKDSVKTEYIPIYVNLKEWVTHKDWHKEKPTWQDLEAFVKQSLTDKDRYLGDFFEQHYHVLDENGNLFFVLDSFDEIPQVLGTTADSQLIEELSIVCREFLQGAKQRRSKGILASREYRMPREEYFGAKTILRVRPFTFEKIEHSLTQSGRIPKHVVEQLLRERPELVPSLRNPFISSLLKSYLENNNFKFPTNQAELFEDYIRKSIESGQQRRGLSHIAYDEIISTTIKIAKYIFSDSGLQAPLSQLRQHVPHPYFDQVVEIMRYTRIARGDVNHAHEFSFAHRRFYEYFVVQDLLRAGKANLPLENIPTDSRWRDTLVLYCEVAPFEEARRIANYCWFEVIEKNYDIRNRASKHCLRFLIEAYRGRKEALTDFQLGLTSLILDQIYNDTNLVDLKFAVEGLSILEPSDIEVGAIRAFSIGNPWINDTALRSCRNLHSLSDEFEYEMKTVLIPSLGRNEFLDKMGLKLLYSKPKLEMSQKELIMSLSLSEAFVNLKHIVEWQHKKKAIILFSRYLIIVFFIGFFVVSTANYELPVVDDLINNNISKTTYEYYYGDFLKSVILSMGSCVLLILFIWGIQMDELRKKINNTVYFEDIRKIEKLKLSKNFSDYIKIFISLIKGLLTSFLLVFSVSWLYIKFEPFFNFLFSLSYIALIILLSPVFWVVRVVRNRINILLAQKNIFDIHFL